MNKIKTLIKHIKKSKNIVFFGGAGVSTESGIPDFRSKDGLYNQKNEYSDFSPEYLLSRDCLEDHPDVFFRFFREKMDVRDASPSITHEVLAKLEALGKLSAVVTQNIDGLHQKAGSKTVYELHGSLRKCICRRCGKEYDGDCIFTSKEPVPHCSCGGIIRPGIVLYGEILPDVAQKGAIDAIRKADMLIIGGTSLKVYPAANFIYEFAGDCLSIINKEKVSLMMGEEDIFIQSPLGDVFKEINKLF